MFVSNIFEASDLKHTQKTTATTYSELDDRVQVNSIQVLNRR